MIGMAKATKSSWNITIGIPHDTFENSSIIKKELTSKIMREMLVIVAILSQRIVSIIMSIASRRLGEFIV